MKDMILRMFNRRLTKSRCCVDVIDDPYALADYLDVVAEGYRT